VAAFAAPAGADLGSDLDEVNDRIEALRGEVGGVREQRTELANEVLDTAARLDEVAAELNAAEAVLAETEAAITVTEDRLEELAASVASREQRVERLRTNIAETTLAARERAIELYMAAGTEGGGIAVRVEDVARFAVGIAYADRVQEVADRDIATLANLQEQEGREIARLDGERVSLGEQVAELEAQRSEYQAQAAVVEGRRAEVATELTRQQEALDRLDDEISHIEGEIAALAREEEWIKELIRLEQFGEGNAPGVLFRPVPGGVSSGFGYRIHPIYGDRRLHTGWDMNAGCNAAIRAAGEGRVIFSGWRGGYGNAIIIDHGGGMVTLYAHQNRLDVGYGAPVATGDIIGLIGSTGTSTSCHLHFEVRINGDPVDPTPYL
jgi:murein DD-endopeptidase MepM/ murein hydrolase activator NlpD